MMEICNSVPIDGTRKTRSLGKGKRKWNNVTSEYAGPVAELCPTLVSQYIEGPVKKKRSIDEVTKIKQHVCHLGWTIEFLYDDMPRFRYISPEGKMCMSLRQVCKDLYKTLSPAYPQLQEPLNHECQGKELNSCVNFQPEESLKHCLDINGTLSPAYPQLQEPLNHEGQGKKFNSCVNFQPEEPLKHCLDINGTLSPAYHQLPEPLNDVCQQKEVKSAANPQPLEPSNHVSQTKEVNSFTNSQPQEPSKHMSERKDCFDLNGTLSPAYPQLQEQLNHLCQVKEVKSFANPQEPLKHMSQREEVNFSAYSQPQEPLNNISQSKKGNPSENTPPQEALKDMNQRKEISSANPQLHWDLNHMSQGKQVNSSANECFFEPELCSQAITQWYEIGGDRHSTKKDNKSIAIKKARGHLAACGWKFFLVPKGTKLELRYVSPEGKCYISLRMACKGFLEGQGSFCSPVKGSFGSPVKGNSGSPVKGNSGSLDSTESRSIKRNKKSKAERSPKKPVKGITRSSRRAKEFCVHNSSHRSPRTVLSLLIENDMVLPGERVQYLNKKDSHAMGVGEITNSGIKCKCCGKVYGLSAFEAHCGSTYHRPAANIFLDDGKSLMQCQMQIVHKRNALKESACNKLNGKQYPNNDGTCAICHYEGELLLCDECPSSFHKSCIGLKDIPEGDWFCPSCCCKICGKKYFHEDTGQSDGKRALSCYQCEHKYHLDCLQLKGADKMDIIPKKWFCSKTCEKIFSGLRSCLGMSVSVGVGLEGLTWTLLRSRTSDYCQDDLNDIEMLTESYSKLNVALEVIHECFEPMKNFRTGRDVADDVIFSRGSNQARVNFQGFYTVVLEKNEELITVAAFRVHGEKVAELPLICTRFQYRGKGMGKLLMKELESILGDLGIERLILPAAPEVLSTWTSSFGFSRMSKEERLELLDYTFLDFRDTIMCHKILGKKESIS